MYSIQEQEKVNLNIENKSSAFITVSYLTILNTVKSSVNSVL